MIRKEYLSCLLLLLAVMTLSCDKVASKPQVTQTAGQRFKPKPVVEVESKVSRMKLSDWKVRELTFATSEDIHLVDFPTSTTGWAATGNGRLYKTADSGAHWKRVELKLPEDAGIVSISFVTPEFGWVLAQEPFSKTGLSRSPQFWLLQTGDEGRTWSELFTGKDANLNRAVLVSREQGWLVGRKWSQDDFSKQSYLVLQTIDGGTNWIDHSPKMVVPIPGSDKALHGDSISDIDISSPSEVTLLTLRGAIFHTSDQGQTWSIKEFIPKPDNVCVCNVGLLKSKELWVAGGTSGIEGSWSFYSRVDNSSRYEYAAGGVYFSDLVALSDNEILAVGSIPATKSPTALDAKSDGVVFYSSDGGRNWSTVYRRDQSGSIRSLAKLDSRHLLAVGKNGLLIELIRS